MRWIINLISCLHFWCWKILSIFFCAVHSRSIVITVLVISWFVYFPENTLLKILQNEEKMEEYLQESGDKPLSIDPIIWQVHLSAPAKKRMPILNRIFQELLKKYSLVFSFLPDHMVLAKVYKILNIPFNVISSKTSMIDLISCRKPTKWANGHSNFVFLRQGCSDLLHTLTSPALDTGIPPPLSSPTWEIIFLDESQTFL